jgi:hypothetical protein
LERRRKLVRFDPHRQRIVSVRNREQNPPHGTRGAARMVDRWYVPLTNCSSSAPAKRIDS